MRNNSIRFGAGAVLLAAFTTLGARQPAPSTEMRRAPIKILLFYDMEGASGVVDDATMNPEKPDAFAKGRQSLIDEVNAVIAGLFDGGATIVEVKNAHGYGGDSLVPRDRLDQRARINSDPRLLPYNPANGLSEFGYHAVVTVAMHDKPLSGGFSPHTLGAGISPIFNGAAATETELVGYAYGTAGIPVIFASGDDHLQRTLGAVMPWVEYVTVKRIVAPTVPVALPAEEVRRELQTKAARAVRGLEEPGRMRVMRLTAPFRAGFLPTYPRLLLPGVGNIPGLERHGDTVTFLAKDYRSAYLGFFALQRISLAFYRERILNELSSRPGIADLVKQITDSTMERWDAFEKGKWKP